MSFGWSIMRDSGYLSTTQNQVSTGSLMVYVSGFNTSSYNGVGSTWNDLSGNGNNMTANKHQGIRSALCWTAEIAKLAREHNDANIVTLPARFITEEEAFAIVDIFFSTDFEGGRHQNRVNKIACV